MATTASTYFSTLCDRPSALASEGTRRRRRISPQAARALQTLGNAVEYLSDEFVNNGESYSANNSQLAAMRLLMDLNRQVFVECPELPTLSERFRALFPVGKSMTTPMR
jgi:hypothetical protein